MNPIAKPIEQMTEEEITARIAELRRERRTGMSEPKKRAIKVAKKEAKASLTKVVSKMRDEDRQTLLKALAEEMGVKLDEI